MGRFVDATWAYRFGPPAQDLIVLSLERGDELLSQSFRYPSAPPVTAQPLSRVGLRAHLQNDEGAGARVTVASDAFAYGVRVYVPGYATDDDSFGVEPGHARTIGLRPVGEPGWLPPSDAALTAINVSGRVQIEVDGG